MDTQAIIAQLKKYPILVVAILVAIIAGLILYLRWGELTKLEENYNRTEEQWNAILTNAERAVNLEQELATVQSLSDEIELRLMNPANKARNFQFFYNLESRNNVRILSLDQEDPVDNPPDWLPELDIYQGITFELSVSGRWENLIGFLYELENSRRFVRVDEYTLRVPSGVTADPRTLEVVIRLDVLGQQTS